MAPATGYSLSGNLVRVQTESPYSLSARGVRLGGGSSSFAGDAGSADETGSGIGSFTSRLGARGYDQVGAALHEAKARVEQRAYVGSNSSGAENEVLPYRYLARDGSGHNTPQTAVLIEGRATRDYLELDDYDVLGNRTGYTTQMNATPSSIGYGEEMWHLAKVAWGVPKGAANGGAKLVVGAGRLLWQGAQMQGLQDGGVAPHLAYQVATQSTANWWSGEVISYNNVEERIGGFAGEFASPFVYGKAAQLTMSGLRSLTFGNAELAIGTAARPTVQWAPNAGGVVRTPDEMMALAKQAGVTFPEDVRVFWVKPSQLLNTEGAQAEYSVLQANLGGGRIGNAANLGPNDLVTWESFQTKAGTVPVRVSTDLLRSDEAAIAHLAHESYELNGLYNSLEVQGNLMRYGDLNRLVRPVASETGVSLGGVANNLHENAWTYADQVILKWRGR